MRLCAPQKLCKTRRRKTREFLRAAKSYRKLRPHGPAKAAQQLKHIMRSFSVLTLVGACSAFVARPNAPVTARRQNEAPRRSAPASAETTPPARAVDANAGKPAHSSRNARRMRAHAPRPHALRQSERRPPHATRSPHKTHPPPERARAHHAHHKHAGPSSRTRSSASARPSSSSSSASGPSSWARTSSPAWPRTSARSRASSRTCRRSSRRDWRRARPPRRAAS